jgi:hypothetical protein
MHFHGNCKKIIAVHGIVWSLLAKNGNLNWLIASNQWPCHTLLGAAGAHCKQSGRKFLVCFAITGNDNAMLHHIMSNIPVPSINLLCQMTWPVLTGLARRQNRWSISNMNVILAIDCSIAVEYLISRKTSFYALQICHYT